MCIRDSTDAELVALARVHHAFHVVEPCVDLTLDDRLEVRLHLLAVDLDDGRQRIFQIAGVNVRTVDGDLVILDLGGIPHQDQLTGGVLGGPELDLHIRLTDDLALERGGKRHGDGQLLGLDLDATQLERLLDRLIMVGAALQSARNLVLAQVNIDHDREAQRDRAGAGRHDHIVDRAEGCLLYTSCGYAPRTAS